MKTTLFWFGILIPVCLATAAETVYTKRSNNYVREGPGAYFQLVAVVPENTSVIVQERKGSWMNVRLSDKKKGWMSENSLVESLSAGARATPLEKVWSSPKASRAGVSAAIRGFAEKRDQTPPGSVETVLKNSVKTFTAAGLGAFRKPVEQDNRKLAGRLSMDNLNLGRVVYDAGIAEQQVGLGIAARLGAKGFVANTGLVEYANLICATLTANSPVYDWDFTVFVINDSTMNGFALPGGYVFLTLGAVQMCSDEAELASIIAHEMAHIIRRHGLQEMTKRTVNVKSDNAFNELEEEVGPKTEDEAELDDLMRQTYESIVSPRLYAYELEADRVAAVLLAKTGYDPFGLVRTSQKAAWIPKERPGIFDANYMAPDNLGKRAKETEKFVNKYFRDNTNGARMRERFVSETAGIR
jgi:uncharacterized protein YgiM (DUF1202 family)